MLGQRGKTWRGAVSLFFSVVMAPVVLWAAEPANALTPAPPPTVYRAVSLETPMEAQLLGERPPGPQSAPLGLWPEGAVGQLPPGFSRQERDGTAVMQLLQNVQVRITFLYGGEGPAGGVERPAEPNLLFKSSLDYSLLPNLQVGLSGFLYHSAADGRYFQRRYGDVILGMGPGIRYDLGRWSLTLQSQYGSGGRDHKEGLQNWFRVWYAF